LFEELDLHFWQSQTKLCFVASRCKSEGIRGGDAAARVVVRDFTANPGAMDVFGITVGTPPTDGWSAAGDSRGDRGEPTLIK